MLAAVRKKRRSAPCAVVGIGGGSTLDTAKALSNLFANDGRAEDYQGWNLVPNPGVFKIGVPTLSGTGAESSRTCVMINPANGLKLGMNSDHTLYDLLILDPDLTATVPREQFFHTGMDTYIHCIESLAGRHRHAVSDAFSRQALTLCREVFLEGDMKAAEAREKMMVASYLGGCAIANSFVGVVHPFSAGLSVVLGVHHGLANCIVLNVMDEFYPAEAAELRAMAARQKIALPKGLCARLTKGQFDALYRSTIVHEKPLANALGDDFRGILTLEKVVEKFKLM
jgi:3-deoxy-alpha-D-manno-octulosonate 8-oxidase